MVQASAAPADRPLVRSINRAMVLHEVRQRGPLSRAAIARATGLSSVTVGAIAGELLSYGLVAEQDGAPSGRGRPASLLSFAPSSFQAVGIKLMEDHLVGAATNLDAEPLAEAEHGLRTTQPAHVVDAVCALVDRLVADAVLDRGRLLGVGIGMAGVVDGDEGVCRHSPFFGWRDVPIAARAAEALGTPVMVENDVNTLALAERWFGVGHDVDDFLLVTLGRGVGLGIVREGRLHRGAHGGAGEFGHTVVDGNNRPCSCGNVGCLEATVSESALLEAAKTLSRAGGRELDDVEELYRRAGDDPRLRALLEQAGGVLGRGLANLVNLFAPSLVIVSGEGVRAGSIMLEAVRQEVSLHVFPGLRDTYKFAIEPLPDAAWARGAASLVLGELFDVPLRAGGNLLWADEKVP
jgi:N-acetylglucosamine repressor